MDSSRRFDVGAMVLYLNALRESLKDVQEIVGINIDDIIPPQWTNSVYTRDPVIRSNIIVCRTTSQGSTSTSIDSQVILSQLNDLTKTFMFFEFPDFLRQQIQVRDQNELLLNKTYHK